MKSARIAFSVVLAILCLATAAFAVDAPSTKPTDATPVTRPARAGFARELLGDRGTITKVDPMSITIMTMPVRTAGPTMAPSEKTYSIDENTSVSVGRIMAARQDVGGNTVRTVQSGRGSVNDLQVGQTVFIRADGDVALNITVMPALVVNGAGAVVNGGGVAGQLRISSTVNGFVLKADSSSLTIGATNSPAFGNGAARVAVPRGKGSNAASERTFSIGEKTRVFTPATGTQVDLPDGQTLRSYRSSPSNAAALKAGQRVSVQFDGDAAISVSVMPPINQARQVQPAKGIPPATQPGAARPMVGKVLKLDPTSITIGITGPWPRGVPGGPTPLPAASVDEQTFRIDEKTKVYSGVVTDAGTADLPVRDTHFTPASIAELQVGQTVIFRADGDNLVYIGTMPTGQ